MKIFILSILVVSFISMCFFKKKFWENRYLILLIIGGVALIATLTTNYATRGSLNKKVNSVWEKPMETFNINDSLVVNDFNLTANKESELTFRQHLVGEDDTTVIRRKTHYLFYYGDEKNLKIGYILNNDLKCNYIKDFYIAPSDNDSTAYVAKLKQNYDPNPKYWTAGFSLPRVQTVICFYIPPTEYAAIPDSLIRKLPF